MKTTATVLTEVVVAITCDRCQKHVARDEPAWHEITSICFAGGYESVFGDSMQVSIDLCQNCLKDTLGQWIRIEDVHPIDWANVQSAQQPLADDLALKIPEAARATETRPSALVGPERKNGLEVLGLPVQTKSDRSDA